MPVVSVTARRASAIRLPWLGIAAFSALLSSPAQVFLHAKLAYNSSGARPYKCEEEPKKCGRT